MHCQYKGSINVGSQVGRTSDLLFDEAFDEAYGEVFGSPVQPSDKAKRKSFQRGAGDYCWRQKGGKVISMHDMTVRHLKNAIRICELTHNSGKADQLQEVLAEKEIEELCDEFDDIDEEQTVPPGHPDEML